MLITNQEITDLAALLGIAPRALSALADKYASLSLNFWETRLQDNLRALASPKPEAPIGDEDSKMEDTNV